MKREDPDKPEPWTTWTEGEAALWEIMMNGESVHAVRSEKDSELWTVRDEDPLARALGSMDKFSGAFKDLGIDTDDEVPEDPTWRDIMTPLGWVAILITLIVVLAIYGGK